MKTNEREIDTRNLTANDVNAMWLEAKASGNKDQIAEAAKIRSEFCENRRANLVD